MVQKEVDKLFLEQFSVLIENVIAQITSSRNRLKKYEAELETMMEKPGDKDFDKAERLADKAANELIAARKKAVSILRGTNKVYKTPEEVAGTNIRVLEDYDDVDMKSELKEILTPLTKSTREEQVSNIVEERKNTPLGKIDDLMAEKQAMHAKYFRLKRKLTNPNDMTPELASMSARYNEINKLSSSKYC